MKKKMMLRDEFLQPNRKNEEEKTLEALYNMFDIYTSDQNIEIELSSIKRHYFSSALAIDFRPCALFTFDCQLILAKGFYVKLSW